MHFAFCILRRVLFAMSSPQSALASSPVPAAAAGSPAQPLSEEQVGEIREAVALFDKDGDGTISARELSAAMHVLGQTPTDGDVASMLASVDANGDGVIDFEEFVALMSVFFHHQGLHADGDGANEEQDLVKTFRVFDRDGDGFISSEELRIAFVNRGEQLDDGQVAAMMRLADTDGDGRVSLAEFLVLARSVQL